ncbi:MAG: hypothetical protein ACM3UU_05210 [Ignavibacteriales bacterium]
MEKDEIRTLPFSEATVQQLHDAEAQVVFTGDFKQIKDFELTNLYAAFDQYGCLNTLWPRLFVVGQNSDSEKVYLSCNQLSMWEFHNFKKITPKEMEGKIYRKLV